MVGYSHSTNDFVSSSEKEVNGAKGKKDKMRRRMNNFALYSIHVYAYTVSYHINTVNFTKLRINDSNDN